MSILRKLGIMAMTGVLSAGMLAGCSGTKGTTADSTASGGKKFEVGYVNLANTDTFCMSRITALTAELTGTDFNVSFTDGNNDNQKQIDQTNAFLAKGVDALIIVPADSDAIGPAISAANSKGTPVICLGIKANSGDFIYIGSANYDAGHMQGEYMASALPDNANVLYLAGTAGLEHSAERRQGFKAALSEAGRDDITILADQDGDYVKDEAMRICDAWIQTYSDGTGSVTFDAIIAANDQMALGAMESLKGAGLLTNGGEVLISGVDGTDEAVSAVAEGYMAQTILQDAPGQAATAHEILEKIAKGETFQNEIFVPFQSIIADNVADYQ